MQEKRESLYDPTGTKTLEVISQANHFNKWMYESIKPWLKGDVLEIGSGIGNISSFLIQDNFRLTLSDINPEYTSLLNQEYGATHDILSIDLQHPRFNDSYSALYRKYDTVFMLNVIEHLERDQDAVRHAEFMLRPEGHLIMLAPAYRQLYCRFDRELGHYRRYTTKSLTATLEGSSLEKIHAQYFNAAGIAGWLSFGKIAGRKSIGSEFSAFDKLVPVLKYFDKLLFHRVGLSAIVVAKKK